MSATFCPLCQHMLFLKIQDEESELICRACPYHFRVHDTYSRDQPLPDRKTVDDVIGGQGAWDNVDKTEATCRKCGNTHAYFLQIQLRSADEPSTEFYKCTACNNEWREG